LSKEDKLSSFVEPRYCWTRVEFFVALLVGLAHVIMKIVLQ